MKTKLYAFVFVCLMLLAPVEIHFRNADAAKKEKVTICHKGKTKQVPPEAVNGHLRHGDTRGACRQTPPPPPGPVLTETPGDPGEEPSVTPVPWAKGASDNDIAAITRIIQPVYIIQPGGEITVWYIGEPLEYVRACPKQGKCIKLPAPEDATPVTHNEWRATLKIGYALEPGTYSLFAHGAYGKTGNERNFKLVVSK